MRREKHEPQKRFDQDQKNLRFNGFHFTIINDEMCNSVQHWVSLHEAKQHIVRAEEDVAGVRGKNRFKWKLKKVSKKWPKIDEKKEDSIIKKKLKGRSYLLNDRECANELGKVTSSRLTHGIRYIRRMRTLMIHTSRFNKSNGSYVSTNLACAVLAGLMRHRREANIRSIDGKSGSQRK
jgi:hypothetical protein